MAMNEKKKMILEGTVKVFNKNGIKFTMDDLAKEMGMSKKTIYMYFDTKESLLNQMVDYTFDLIAERKLQLTAGTSNVSLEMIKNVLIALPSDYQNVSFEQLYLLKDRYPKIYHKVEVRLESGWEDTFHLLERGMKEGVLREFSLPLFKTMLEATIEQFFQRDVLVRNKISYQDALSEISMILVEGIAKN